MYFFGEIIQKNNILTKLPCYLDMTPTFALQRKSIAILADIVCKMAL